MKIGFDSNRYFGKRLLFCAVFVLGLAGCAQPTPETVYVTKEVVKEVSRDPGKLVIYVGRSETLVGPIVKQFAEVTGIDVQAKYGKTGAIAATLLEEGRKSPADIFFAQDPGGLGVMAKAGMLKPLDSDLLEKVPSFIDWITFIICFSNISLNVLSK